MRSSKVNIGDSILSSQYNNLRDDAFGGAFLLPHEQTTPDLTLKIEAGVCYIGNTRVVFAGGNSPSFTAPTANPRIDLLTINSSGVLERTAGTEAASPAVPTYPNDKLVICEVFNRVGQTTIRDVDTLGQGYIKQDVRPFLGGAFIASDNQVDANAAIQMSKIRKNSSIPPETDNLYDLGSASFRWKEGRFVTLFGDGSNLTGLAASVTTRNYTAGESLTAGNAVYLKKADGKVYKAVAGASETGFNFIGFAQATVALNATVAVAVAGIDANQSALTVGSWYFLTATAGNISDTPGTTVTRRIGLALSATQILIVPDGGLRVARASGTYSVTNLGANPQTTAITTGFRPLLVLCRAVMSNNTSTPSFETGDSSTGDAAGMGFQGYWLNGTHYGAQWTMGDVSISLGVAGVLLQHGAGSDNGRFYISAVDDTSITVRLDNTGGFNIDRGLRYELIIIG